MLIGISGYARSGKDSIANYLVEKHGFTRMSFADPMREAVLRLDPMVDCGGMYIPLSVAHKQFGWEGMKEYAPQVRELLQRMGTEVGRNLFGENFWVEQLLKKAIELGGNIVIPDVRFINEADAIKMVNGQVWRVNRPGVDPVNLHPSETEMDAYSRGFDIVIENDTNLEELFSELDILMTGFGVHNGS